MQPRADCQRLVVRAHVGRGVACLRVIGDLDHPCADELALPDVRHADVVEVDLRGVTYADTAGLYQLVDLVERRSAPAAITRYLVGTAGVLRALEASHHVERLEVHLLSAG